MVLIRNQHTFIEQLSYVKYQAGNWWGIFHSNEQISI